MHRNTAATFVNYVLQLHSILGRPLAKKAKTRKIKPLTPDQIVAYHVYTQAQQEGAPPRDTVPLTPFLTKMVNRFNKATGQSLTKAEFWALTLSVLKIGRANIEKTLRIAGLSPRSKPPHSA